MPAQEWRVKVCGVERLPQDAEMVDLLIDAEALRARQCKWRAFLVWNQGASAGSYWFEVALVKQDVLEFKSRRFAIERRINGVLLGPQCIKLVLDHGSINIEIVFLVLLCFSP